MVQFGNVIYDTEDNLTTNNPVIPDGSYAVATDTAESRGIGDGVKTWSQLSYAEMPTSSFITIQQWLEVVQAINNLS